MERWHVMMACAMTYNGVNTPLYVIAHAIRNSMDNLFFSRESYLSFLFTTFDCIIEIKNIFSPCYHTL